MTINTPIDIAGVLKSRVSLEMSMTFNAPRLDCCVSPASRSAQLTITLGQVLAIILADIAKRCRQAVGAAFTRRTA